MFRRYFLSKKIFVVSNYICSPCCTVVAIAIGKIFRSALDFLGMIAARLFILYHGVYISNFGSCRQRAAIAFECVLRGATGDVVVVGRQWFQKAGKASMIPHADDDKMGTN